MSTPSCKGRIRVTENDRKWYVEKGKSSMLYTCCEECFNNNIKDTPKEETYELGTFVGANCDYFLYETDCNFEDCSITNNGFRVSIVTDNGKRCKLSTTENATFLVKEGDIYSLVIENLTGDVTSEMQRIMLETLTINNDEFQLDSSEKWAPYIIEARITMNQMTFNDKLSDKTNDKSPNDMPKPIIKKLSHMYDENETDEPNEINETIHSLSNINEVNDNSESNKKLINQYDDLVFTLIKCNHGSLFNISELEQSLPNIFCDPSGIPLLKLQPKENINYKAFLGINIYECNSNDTSQFSISVKYVSENESNSNDEFDISI